MSETTKNYDSEGFRDIMVSEEGKTLMDALLNIKASIHEEWRPTDSKTKQIAWSEMVCIIAPARRQEDDIEENILKNWYRELSRRLKLPKEKKSIPRRSERPCRQLGAPN